MKIRQTILVLLLTSLVIPFAAPFVTNPQKFGLFFGWEMGTIFQTLYAFHEFALHSFPPHISSTKHMRNILLILAPIIISLFVYILIKTTILQSFILPASLTFRGKDFIISLFRDSITMVPMLVFFLFNLKFYLEIKQLVKSQPRNKVYIHYLALLKRVIFTIDLPCLIPYMAVIFFAYQHSYSADFQWESYVSGAGSLLLMVSNF
jgi:hypothetical protein